MYLRIVFFICVFFFLGATSLFATYNDHNLIASNIITNQHNLSGWTDFSKKELDNHPVRKTEMVLFISVPLAFFLHTLIFETYRHLAVISASSQGVENASSFNFIREINEIETIGDVLEPFTLFNWINSIVWATVIANNFVIETYIDKELYHRTFRNTLREQNWHIQLFNHNF